MVSRKHRTSGPGGGRGRELWTLTVTLLCQRPTGRLPSAPPAAQLSPLPCPRNAQSWPLCPNNPSPRPACLASGLDSQGWGCVFGKTSHWGQEFRKEGESGCTTLTGLNAPHCELSPDRGPGHTKSPTVSNSLSPSPGQSPSPGRAPSS